MLEDGIISPCLLIVLLTLQSQILPRFLDNRPLDLLSNAKSLGGTSIACITWCRQLVEVLYSDYFSCFAFRVRNNLLFYLISIPEKEKE